jgi:hypothetical protein
MLGVLFFATFSTMFLYFNWLISELTALEDAEMEFRTVSDEVLYILTVRRSNFWSKSYSREVVYEEQFYWSFHFLRYFLHGMVIEIGKIC